MGVSRAACYRWLSGKKCARELENEKIAEIMEQIHTENPDKGYRRIKDDLVHDHKMNVNEKRVLRICRSLDIKSTIKYKNNGCTRQAANPNAHPLFHSDRGFQYTNRIFYNKLKAAKVKQSMSRVAKCIDNGPMEGFWGILKRERYYGKRFTSREELVSMIENYITYYNNRRVQRNLGVLTPMEKHNNYLLAA